MNPLAQNSDFAGSPGIPSEATNVRLLARTLTALGACYFYNDLLQSGVFSSMVAPMSQTFPKMLIGEDCADHFAIRILPLR